MVFAANRSPQLSFVGVPAGCASLALLCIDEDAPTLPDDVNQEGRTVAEDLPRGPFVHWVMVDLAPDCPGLDEGTVSEGVIPRGESRPCGPEGSRQGKNDYTHWFAGHSDMAGTYLGYDGPAPPWNDERLHHYHFTLYALDLPRLPVQGAFTAAEVRAAMQGHILAEATLVGTYTCNPALHA